jgi:serine/threonine-protein kinase
VNADIVALISVFGMPVAIVGIVSYFRYRTRALTARSSPAAERELEALRHERKQLEARVQNLESIVCSVDLELNARLNRLAESALKALPPAPVAVAAGGPAALAPPTPPRPPAPSELTPGRIIARRYVLERELGRGGMGQVWLARDEQLAERVALKIVHTTFAADPAEAIERFRREVAAARKITHPNVIRIHDLVEDDGLVLLSMELVDGMSLAAHLGRAGALRLDDARAILAQICDAVAAAHAVGVVHRDLKPGNILLDKGRRVKVIDFGLAKASFLAGMTATGLILGTPEYMSPEQVRGLPCDVRTDVYSLGALAYHLVTGRPPFSGETPIAIGFAHVTETPRAPSALRPELPTELEAAILRALEKDPARRFPDAQALRAALG